MGRLRTLTILLIVCAWGVATDGAPPDSAAPSTETGARPPAPAPPVEYLKTGARLFNNGQYDLAAKYINAAQSYRDQLSGSEQKVLDAYLREMAKAPADAASRRRPTAPAADPGPATPATPPAASGLNPPGLSLGRRPAPMPTPPARRAGPARRRGRSGAVTRAAAAPASSGAGVGPPPPAGADAKAQARWLLAAAREQMRMGGYDDAAAKVSQARALNVRWGLFDDTPDKVAEAIEKARPKAVVAHAPATQTKDRDRQAKAKLKDARAAIEAKQFEQAEAIALDVKSWNLSYGMFEDIPDKVAAAARALRAAATRSATGPAKDEPSQGVYDVLVQEARQLMSAGRLDEAEAKAKRAQRMNVVPPADRRPRRGRHARHRDGGPANDQTPRARGPSVAAGKGRPPRSGPTRGQRLALQGRQPPPTATRRRARRSEREANDLLSRQATARPRLAFADRALRAQVNGQHPARPARDAPAARSRPAAPTDQPRPATPPSRPPPANGASNCWPRPAPCTPTATTPPPRKWPSRPRPTSSASTPRPMNSSPRSPWPSRAAP